MKLLFTICLIFFEASSKPNHFVYNHQQYIYVCTLLSSNHWPPNQYAYLEIKQQKKKMCLVRPPLLILALYIVYILFKFESVGFFIQISRISRVNHSSLYFSACSSARRTRKDQEMARRPEDTIGRKRPRRGEEKRGAAWAS